MPEATHVPVLVTEVLALFRPQPGDRLLDATLGLGGHAAAWLDASAATGTVVGLEVDPKAAAVAKERLAAYGNRVTVIESNYVDLKDSLKGGGIVQTGSPPSFTHILFDLGIGSHQLADGERGFSFQSAGPLLMRFGRPTDRLPPARVETLNHLERHFGYLPDADEMIHSLTVDDLATVIRTYGEERYARRIAQALHALPPQSSATAVAQAIAQAVPSRYAHGRIHPATRTFQALRLAANRELEVLQAALPQAWEVLQPGGILAVISFHSLEDRIVKHFVRGLTASCICGPEIPECICDRLPRARRLTKHALQAGAEERTHNPRARSAKLRAVLKL